MIVAPREETVAHLVTNRHGKTLCGVKNQFDKITTNPVLVTCKDCIAEQNRIVDTAFPSEDPDARRDSESRRGEIVKDRSDFYGDVRLSHQSIGLAFEAVLSNRYHWLAEALRDKSLVGQFVPDELAALLLAAFKVVRASRPEYRQDSYDDGINFLKFSQDMREQDEEDKLGTIK